MRFAFWNWWSIGHLTKRQLRTTHFHLFRFYSILSTGNETVPKRQCGFYEVPARTVSSSSGLRRREMCCMRKYTSAYVHASKFGLSGCLLCARVCLHAPGNDLCASRAERSHWSRNDAPGTRVITSRSPAANRDSIKEHEIVVDKKKYFEYTHARITRIVAEFGSLNWKGIEIISTFSLRVRIFSLFPELQIRWIWRAFR